ncbi:MAG TPA: hypothetical protein VEJ18_06755, partial [Planctomycetota bacterium]|nr:hypothetical protein [Planctomycetota bacterium]
MAAATLALLCLLQKAPDRPLQGAAAKCGSEIPWTTSIEAAQAKAKETGRPILWWVPTLAGSPMDRTLVLEKYMLAGPWMMPAVVPLVRDHFVPLRLEGTPAHRARFRLAPMETVEPVLLFLDPDLGVLHCVDRLTTFHEGWFIHLLRGVLAKAGRPAPGAARIDDPAEALWRKGAELHRAGRDEEGRAEWRKIPEGRWAWKAAAELAGDGPFVRGFEVEEAIAPEGLPSSTTLPARDPDVGRAAKFLVGLQRSSGAWTDSHYNFGGDDSLPNVWMAVTALAALALREIDDPAAKGAVERAEKYMRDEAGIAAEDTDEIAWAHAYRLLYFAKDA